MGSGYQRVGLRDDRNKPRFDDLLIGSDQPEPVDAGGSDDRSMCRIPQAG